MKIVLNSILFDSRYSNFWFSGDDGINNIFSFQAVKQKIVDL